MFSLIGAIHILRKHFLYEPQHFHEFFEKKISSLIAKNFKVQQHENLVSVMLKKKSQNKVWGESLGSQIKFLL